MMILAATTSLPAGLLFPTTLVHSGTFGVLAALVAINTVMYSALAVAKMLPKVYPSGWVSERGRRSQSRSIYPEAVDDAPTEAT